MNVLVSSDVVEVALWNQNYSRLLVGVDHRRVHSV